MAEMYNGADVTTLASSPSTWRDQSRIKPLDAEHMRCPCSSYSILSVRFVLQNAKKHPSFGAVVQSNVELQHPTAVVALTRNKQAV